MNIAFKGISTEKIFAGVDRKRLTDRLITEGTKGNIDALAQLQKCFDPYIRRLATLRIHGVRYLNEDLYERLKEKLVVATVCGFTPYRSKNVALKRKRTLRTKKPTRG